jgi:hypothetical protein
MVTKAGPPESPGAVLDVDPKSGNPLIQVFVIHDEMDVNIKQQGKGLKDHKGKFDP